MRNGLSATSTITQQLARNVFLNSNRTIDRKLREAVLAMALEAKFSKQEILELYLNKVYFGGGAYGIDSASRKFFSHPATHLSNAEAAIIAGMVKAPSRFSPTADVDAAVARANVVLGLMRDQGMITAEEASVDVRTVNLKKEEGQNSVRYFTDWALPQLDLLLPDGNTDPIQVWTTIDLGMQKAATQAIVDNVPKGAQGALVSMDRDGAILAMVGGTDYVKTNYNRATEALRQPGSAWKLFVYLAALEAGYKPDDKVKDVPVTIDGWSPHNDGGYAGEIDVRSAFAYSKNTVAAQLGNEVGFGAVAVDGPALRNHHADFDLSIDGAWHERGPRPRHDSRLRRGFGQGPVARALRHPQGRHRRRACALPAPEPGQQPAGARLCRRGHHRPVADRGQHRHRPRGADRPAGRRQDRDHQFEQGRLVPRLLERDHHRRVDGPRRCQAGRRPVGRNFARRARSPTSCVTR